MPFEAAACYADLATLMCTELGNLYQKQQELESECSAKIVALYEKFLDDIGWTKSSADASEHAELARQRLFKTTVAKALIEQVKVNMLKARVQLNTSTEAQENTVRPFMRNMQDILQSTKFHCDLGNEQLKKLKEVQETVKKARAEYEAAKSVSSELAENNQAAFTGTSTIRRKDVDKKALLKLMEKEMKTSYALKEAETSRSKVSKNYFNVQLPALYDDMRSSERSRLNALHNFLMAMQQIEKSKVETFVAKLNRVSEVVEAVNVEEDQEDAFETLATIEKEESVTVKSLSNSAIYSGTMSLKRGSQQSHKVNRLGDHGQGWLKQFFVLSSDRHLYCFDAEDSEDVREIMDLSKYHPHSLDNSYFKRNNCFQLVYDKKKHSVNTKNSSKATYNFQVESPQMKSEWLHNFRKFCYCCDNCSILYDFESYGMLKNNKILSKQSLSSVDNQSIKIEADSGPSQTDIGHVPRRFITLWVMEAKDISQINGGKINNSYCTILLDDIKQARTNIKNGDSIFWGEEFKLNDVTPCQNRLSVVLFGSNKSDSFTEYGCVSLRLNNLHLGKRIEEWYTVTPFNKTNQNEQALCTIRIAYLLTNERKLSPALQTRFLDVIIKPPFECIKYVDKFLGSRREEFTKCFIHVLSDRGRELEAIKSLISSEIAMADNPKILFRGNSITTKAVDIYMKVVGTDYLYETLHSLIELIFSTDDNFEVDPSRLQKQKFSVEQKDKMIRKNLNRLLMNVEAITYSIFKSIDKMPSELRSMFAHLREGITAKFDDETTKYTGISGFIFLRLFCPAILSPKLFGLMNEHPNENTARMLTLIAKILQNLANLVEFEGKEAHMEPTEATTLLSPSTLGRKKIMIDFKHEVAALGQLFCNFASDLGAENQTRPNDDVTALLPILNDINQELSDKNEKNNEEERLESVLSSALHANSQDRKPSIDSRSSSITRPIPDKLSKAEEIRRLEEIGRSESIEVENEAFQGFAASALKIDTSPNNKRISHVPKKSVNIPQTATIDDDIKDIAAILAGGGMSLAPDSALANAVLAEDKSNNFSNSPSLLRSKFRSMFSDGHSSSPVTQDILNTSLSSDSPKSPRLLLSNRTRSNTASNDMNRTPRGRSTSSDGDTINKKLAKRLSKTSNSNTTSLSTQSSDNKIPLEKVDQERETVAPPVNQDVQPNLVNDIVETAPTTNDLKALKGPVTPKKKKDHPSATYSPGSILQDPSQDLDGMDTLQEEPVQSTFTMKSVLKSIFTTESSTNTKSSRKDPTTLSANELSNTSKSKTEAVEGRSIVKLKGEEVSVSKSAVELASSDATSPSSESQSLSKKSGFFKSLIKGKSDNLRVQSSDQLFQSKNSSSASLEKSGSKSKSNLFSFSTLRGKKGSTGNTLEEAKASFSTDSLKISLGSSRAITQLSTKDVPIAKPATYELATPANPASSQADSMPRVFNIPAPPTHSPKDAKSTFRMKKTLVSSSVPASSALSDMNGATGNLYGASLMTGGHLQMHIDEEE